MEKHFILIDCIGRGGAEKVAVTIANELAESGCCVHLLILRQNIGYSLNEGVKLHVMSDLQFAKGYLYSVQEVFRGIFWVRRTLGREVGDAPRVLVSHLTRSNLINIFLGLFIFSHKAICVSHNSVGFYRNTGFVRRLLLLAQGVLLPLASRTVCVSKRMAADYRRLFLFRKRSIVSIYNPVRLPGAAAELGESASEAPAEVHVAMIGRFHAVKRHDLAIQALSLLNRNGRRKYILHLVGDGPEQPSVREMIRVAGLESSVIMHGWLDNTMPILEQCSLSLLCSDTEGFPNSIVESLAMGIPVVATDCISGPRELLAPQCDPEGDLPFEHGFYAAPHGALVATGDADALAGAIEYQVLRPDKLQQRLRCINFAEQFEASRIVREYRNLIEAESW